MNSPPGKISQKKINIFISIVVTTAVVLAVMSTLHIYACIKEEQEIEQYKSQCEDLSGQLAENFSWMTEEVRNFVINEEIEALQNYWNEAEVVKTREKLIAQLEEMNLPPQEMRLLNVAKENSDLFGYTEIRAMRLVLDTMDMDESWLPLQVREYVLNIQEKEMTDEEKKNAALQLLFSEQFHFEKNTIMQNVEIFQQTMQLRLDQEVASARETTRSAMGILFVLLGLILCLVFLVVLIFGRMVVRPIQTYSDTLQTSAEYPVLEPSGVKETQIFAEAFNGLLQKLKEASAAKSSFVSVMSHEIRTPLNTINGYNHLLEKTELTDKQKNYMEQIQLANSQLLHVVNQILDFSKLEQNKLMIDELNFDIRQLCSEVQQMFCFDAERRGLYLKLYLEEAETPFLKGDEGKLRQILINLISNGIKFTHKGGVRIKVKTANRYKEGDTDFEVLLVIRIEDTGIGIQEGAKRKIFSVFEQADASVRRNYGGTGLGLAITRQMVELMKGEIQLDTQEGKGSIFTLRIPVHKGISENISPYKIREKTNILPKYNGKRVLLVEDNKINARMEKELLQRYGLAVDLAENGEKAVAKAKEISYDVIFMDIRMSKMDGYTAAKEIRSEGNSRHSYVAALTADAGEQAVKLAYQAGMDDYLIKPFSSEDMGDTLRKALGKSKEPILDTATPLRRLSGDEELYRELLQAFLSEHKKDFEMLRQTEYSSIHISGILHDLKGLCKTLGAARLQEVIKEAEWEEGDNRIRNKIWQIYQETCMEMQKYLSKDMEKRGDINVSYSFR